MLLCVLLIATASASFSFASIGDWGCVPIGGQLKNNELVVAKQFAASAATVDARFVLNVGDSFYYCGCHNVTDPVFKTTFEDVFSESSMMVPWWSCLGNHDYGYPGSADSQLRYHSPNGDRWKMPGRYYYQRFVYGAVNVSLLVLDSPPCQNVYRSSNPAGWDPCGSRIPSCPGCTFHQNIMAQSCTAQYSWMEATLPHIPADDWRIVMTHAPAPELDEMDFLTPLQKWGFDLYINGHVHLLAHYTMDGGGTYVTTGAGCMVNVEEAKRTVGASSCQYRNPLHECQIVWEQTIAGYTTHTFNADYSVLSTMFYDSQGTLMHTAETRKRGAPPGPPGPQPPPPPPPPPGPPGPAPPGKCCYYDMASCEKGETCCDDKGKSYDESVCNGAYGKRHNCIWTGSECVVN